MSDTPDWFWKAIDTKPDASSVTVDDCDINYLSWSQGLDQELDQELDQGLMLVHGHNAHAHWWDFIAPFFKDAYHTVALDMSGMGNSDHREAYSNDLYAKEIVAAADAAKLSTNSILVAHSFGGIQAIRTMALYPDRFKALVLLDSGVRHPDDISERDTQIERLGRAKVYPSKEIAQGRFRLQPPQQCANQYIVDHIARNSVEYDDMDEGWMWKFDEELMGRMTFHGDLTADFQSLTLPCTLIYGAISESFKPRSAEYMQALMPKLEVIALADAQHHLFLDQPMAFVDTLKSVLSRF